MLGPALKRVLKHMDMQMDPEYSLYPITKLPGGVCVCGGGGLSAVRDGARGVCLEVVAP